MKTKLEMAHEWATKHGNAETVGSRQNMVKYAWDYADAMQVEADKRGEEEQSEHVFEAIDEWQPDWSKKTNEELRMLVKTLDGIIESRSDCNHEWDHISTYGGNSNYYVCSCGAEKHPVDDF